MTGQELINWIIENHAENATIKTYCNNDGVVIEDPEPQIFPEVETILSDGTAIRSKDKYVVYL